MQKLISNHAYCGIQYRYDTCRHLIVMGLTRTHIKPNVVGWFRSPNDIFFRVKLPLNKVLCSYELTTFKDDLPLHYYEDIYGG